MTDPIDARTREVKLTRGYTAIIDNDERFDELLQRPWHACVGNRDTTVYARSKKAVGRPSVWMHREVLRLAGVNIPPGFQVDHVNHDSLDNRLANLAVVTVAQNQWNRRPQGSGACRVTGSTRFFSRIQWHRKRIYLGSFDTEGEARSAYQQACARRLAGEKP